VGRVLTLEIPMEEEEEKVLIIIIIIHILYATVRL
jgi:hypothetical protein